MLATPGLESATTTLKWTLFGKMTKKILYTTASLIVIFLVTAGVLNILNFKIVHQDKLPIDIDKKSEDYSLINRSVIVNIGKHFIVNFSQLRSEYEKVNKKYSGKTYIYFSYINNGSWVGINEREAFTAASTIKVPLAMSVYKLAEEGKIKLDEQYTIEEADLDSNFGEFYKISLGKTFTVRELIKIMLEESDNTAMNSIYSILARIGITDPLSNVYEELGWQFLTPPELNSAPNYQEINLKTLANMFLALYNSTYIGPEYSQEVLYYLTQTPFGDKIAAGVPEFIEVSHKIGVSGNDDTFSDCGIVYAPNRNYMLCVGSSGMPESKAATFMSEISKKTYEYVINN